MKLDIINFFFFSSILLLSAISVIYSINTVYSAFFLILCFINSTALLLLLKIEFISIMLIIIYVGAITVLFLFVIMMLDIKTLKFNDNFLYLPIISLIILNYFLEIFVFFRENLNINNNKTTNNYILNYIGETITQDYSKAKLKYNALSDFYYKKVNYPIYSDYENYMNINDYITNTETIGLVLYNYYFILFLIAGLILLVALIGSVMLTKKETNLNINNKLRLHEKLARNYYESVFNIKINNKTNNK